MKTKKRSSRTGGSQRLLNIRGVPSEVHIAEEGDLLDQEEAALAIWKEALFGAELLLLLTSPVYYGLGVPRGDGSAVILLPGFLGSDHYLGQMDSWLTRIGYRPYLSGIRINAECPNLLIRHRLTNTLQTALDETGK